MTAPSTAVAANGTFTLNRDSVRAKLLLWMSADREAPTSLADLNRCAWPASDKYVSKELAHLQEIGAIERTTRGFYVRLVGEVREFRQ